MPVPVRERIGAASVAALLIADLVAVVAVGSPRHAGAVGIPSTSTPTTSTTTTGPPVGVYPLTGLPAYTTRLLPRPALSVKVDNAPDARPQLGLNSADLVTEELVEGGLTRFMATFQSRDAASVGPIRSARPVDADLLRELGGGIFAYSGASAGALAPVQQRSGSVLLSPERGATVFDRVPGRPAPANLFASTTALYAAGHQLSAHLGPPRPLFHYSPQPPDGPAAHTVTLAFSGNSSSGWTASGGVWERTQDGAPARLADGSVITADNVVVLSVATRPSGIYDVRGNQTPLTIFTGSGTCWILRDGVVVKGTWQRPTTDGAVSLVDAGGQPIPLKPGRTWMELLPTPSTPSIS